MEAALKVNQVTKALPWFQRLSNDSNKSNQVPCTDATGGTASLSTETPAAANWERRAAEGSHQPPEPTEEHKQVLVRVLLDGTENRGTYHQLGVTWSGVKWACRPLVWTGGGLGTGRAGVEGL